MRFFVLGGYGYAGRCLARLLLEQTQAQIVVAGPHRAKAVQMADELGAQFGRERVSACRADAADPASLREAFQGVELALIASRTARHARVVAETCLDVGLDYLDIQFSLPKVAALQTLAPRIEAAGRSFITDAGFQPGLPAALIRALAPQFDRMERAVVGCVMNPEGGIRLSEGVTESLEETRHFQPRFYREGAWRSARLTGARDMVAIDFGPEFGKRLCFPMFLEELRTLPQTYSALQAVGYYAAGFNAFTDYLVMPLAMLGARMWPRAAARTLGPLFCWGTRTFSRPPYGIRMQALVQGEKDGAPLMREITLRHTDSYLFTAIPVTACLLQWLDGTARKPGLHTMGQIVDPQRLLSDMARMGIGVT